MNSQQAIDAIIQRLTAKTEQTQPPEGQQQPVERNPVEILTALKGQ